jgi:hypothetical protein
LCGSWIWESMYLNGAAASAGGPALCGSDGPGGGRRRSVVGDCGPALCGSDGARPNSSTYFFNLKSPRDPGSPIPPTSTSPTLASKKYVLESLPKTLTIAPENAYSWVENAHARFKYTLSQSQESVRSSTPDPPTSTPTPLASKKYVLELPWILRTRTVRVRWRRSNSSTHSPNPKSP